MSKKLIVSMLLCVICISSTMQVSAQTTTSTNMRGKEISSNQAPINDDIISSRSNLKLDASLKSLNVTGSSIWYGWQQYAEGRLLCIEGYVTASAKHYTKSTMENKNNGSVYTSAYATGKGTVYANKYDITPPSNPDNYVGRVHYGGL